MSRFRALSRVAASSAAVLTVSGLTAVGVSSTQPAAAAGTPVPGYQNIRINEVTSDGTNRVELYNVGATAVDIMNWTAEVAPSHSVFPVTTIQTIAASSTVLNPGDFFVFSTTTPLTDTNGDAVAVFANDGTFTGTTPTAPGTLVDRVDWSAKTKASPSMARCGGDGYGQWVTGLVTTSNDAITAATFNGPNAAGCPATLPAASLIRINEVTSANADDVELANYGTTAVDVTNWLYIDNGPTHPFPTSGNLGTAAHSTTFSIPAFSPPPGPPAPGPGFGVYEHTGTGQGLGDPDSYILMDPSGTTVDSVTWPTGGATPNSYERCAAVPRTGVTFFQTSTTTSFGTGNSCTPTSGGGGSSIPCAGAADSGTLPPAGVPEAWPGSQTTSVVDGLCQFVTSDDPVGQDLSGLTFDPTRPGVLWGAQNKEWVWKMTKVGTQWLPDTTWAGSGGTGGKRILFSDVVGGGAPDDEGLTVGPNGHLYVTSERDNNNNAFPKDTILEYDPNSTATALTPVHEYDVTSQYPQLFQAGGNKTLANLGFEGVGFVPDSWLVNNNWTDTLTGRTYNPALYPLHGSGLFFAGLENDGTLHPYALNSDGSFVSFPSIPTGQVGVMDVFFDSYTQRLVATCDNTCSETHSFMKISNGRIVVDKVYKNPTGMPANTVGGINQYNNFEGFAISPDCVGGSREALWSDDGNYGSGPVTGAPTNAPQPGDGTYGHALWGGTFPC